MKHNTLRAVFQFSFFIGICTFIMIAGYSYQINYNQRMGIFYGGNITFKKVPKVVIYTATPFFDVPIENSILRDCSEKIKNSCTVTSNNKTFPIADAIVFHSRDINETKLSFFNKNRRYDIPYIMMAMENPFFAGLTVYHNFFNWTMTYRTDSDIFHPYGAFVKSYVPAEVNYSEIWNSKTKETLWMVSNGNAQNKRKELVEKLIKKGMSIDLYGQLYKKEPAECPRRRGPPGCDVKFHSPYKFAIAFENSNCKDYVTEKFWKKAGIYKTVPIVMSRKIYRDLGIPDSMYIAVDDYPNLEEFVHHIQNVTSNEEEYMKYHKWRKQFKIVDTNEGNIGFCQLCQKLAGYKRKLVPHKVYENLNSWHSTSTCDNSFATRFL